MNKLLGMILCIVLTACATGTGKSIPKAADGNDTAQKQEAEKLAIAKAEPAPRVTLKQDVSTLADTVQRLSEHVGGSLVLMNGIENLMVQPVDFRRAPYHDVADELAKTAGCKVEKYPNYCFIYPPGSEAVLEISAGQLDPAYAQMTAGMNFGVDTPLFEALPLIGSCLGITLVADNIVGEARCGSLTLAKIPLQDALDAVLKSARLRKGAFQVESTPEYIFVYAAQNPPRPTLLNPEALTPEQNALLDQKATAMLPEVPQDPAHATMHLGATPLSKILEPLSKQLGVTVTAEEGLGDLPVNPCVLNNVRVRSALDLLIRQWPYPEFGYEVVKNQLVIQRRK